MTVEPPDVRARILAEATRLFGRNGFGSTSVREVVEAAGVTKPALYYWFANKEALYREAVAVQVERLQRVVHESLDGPGSLVERVGRFLERYLRTALADDDGVRLMMIASHPLGTGQPEIDMLSLYREDLRRLAEVFEEGRRAGEVRDDVDPLVAAMSLVGAANLHVVASLYGRRLPDDVHARIARNFLLGVTPR